MNDFLYGMERVNIKKIIILSTFFIIIIVALILFLLFYTNKDKQTTTIEKNSTSTIFYSKDKSMSVELANSFNLKSNVSDYSLELKSSENLDIYISKKDILSNKTLLEVVTADKELFIENFSNTSNISEIKELNVGDNPACLYSFQYLDKVINKAFDLQIVWMQIDNSYYIFDIEYPIDDSTFYPNIVSDVLTSFNTY